MKLQFRKAIIADTEIISTIGNLSFRAAHAESCSADTLDEYVNSHYSLQAIQKQIEQENNNYYIIEQENVAIGFSNFIFNAMHKKIEQQNITKLERLYLLPSSIQQGVGLYALQQIELLCKENNQSSIWLNVWVGNTKAISFYTRNGFEIFDECDFHLTKSHANPNYQMKKEIY
jgi:diamine N-acetyltransferase